MKRITTIVIGLVLLGLVGYGLTLFRSRPVVAPPGGSQALQPAPDFAFLDYEGNTVRRSQFLGKALVVNSWAAWCPFCVEELKDFARAQEEFGDQVVIIAVNRAESLATAKKFSDQVGVTGRIVLLLDPNDSFYRSIGGFSMPETIFVDKDGNIVLHKRGPMDVVEIRQRIRQALNL